MKTVGQIIARKIVEESRILTEPMWAEMIDDTLTESCVRRWRKTTLRYGCDVI